MPIPVRFSHARHARGWRALALLSATAALAVLGTATLTTPEGVAAHAASHQAALAQGTARADRLAVATFGAVYLAADGEPENTALISRTWLNNLDAKIDPMTKTGGFYPLRKLMERLVLWLIFPLSFFYLVHGLVTSRGEGFERVMMQFGIRFFTVLFMLWFYPVWDAILYKGIAKPAAAVIESKETVASILNAVGTAGGTTSRLGDNWMATKNADIIQELGRSSQRNQLCTVSATIGDNGLQECFNPDVPLASQLSACGEMRGTLPGDAESKKSTFQGGPAEQACQEQQVASDGGSTWDWSSPWDSTKRLVNQVVGDYLANTITGWLITLQAYVASAVLWFVWLSVIVGRAISLCFAPVAIVWGLMPGGTHDKGGRWFTGHAEYVMRPVTLAFAMLIFYAIQTAVLGTSMGSGGVSGAVVGFALKLGIFIGFIVMLLKADSLTKLMSGDVVQAAASMGNAARNGVIGVVAGAGAVTMATGGLAAGTALNAAGGATALKGKVMAVMAKGGNLANAAISKMPTAMQTPMTKGLGLARSAGSGAGSALKAAWKMKNTVSPALSAARKGMPTSQQIESQAMVPDVAAMLKQSIVTPFKDAQAGTLAELAKAASKTAEKAKRKRAGSSGDVTKAIQAGFTADAAARESESRGFSRKVTDLDIVTRNSYGDRITRFDDAKDSAGNVRQGQGAQGGGAAFRDMLIDKVVLAGGSMAVAAKRDDHGVDTYTPDATTMGAINDALRTDGSSRDAIMSHASKVFGNRANVPTTLLSDGTEVPDILALLKHDTNMLQGLAEAAQFKQHLDRDMIERDEAVQCAGAKSDSLLALAIRNMPAEFRQRHEFVGPDGRPQLESDMVYGRRLQQEGKRLLRAARFREEYDAADAGTRARLDAAYPRGELDAMKDAKFDPKDAWIRGAAVDVPKEMWTRVVGASALRAATFAELRGGATLTAGGERWGVDMRKFMMSGKHEYRAREGSRLNIILKTQPDLRAKQEEAFKKAVDEATQALLKQIPRKVGQSLEDWKRKNKDRILRATLYDQT